MEEIGAKVCSLLIGVEGFDGGDPSLGLLRVLMEEILHWVWRICGLKGK